MHVLEYTMRHFYAWALLLKQINGKPEQIDGDLKEAAAITEMIVPYRRARLSAVKLAGDPHSPLRIRDDASADEIRAKIMERLAVLTSAGLIDLEALPAPDEGTAKRSIPGVDQSPSLNYPRSLAVASSRLAAAPGVLAPIGNEAPAQRVSTTPRRFDECGCSAS